MDKVDQASIDGLIKAGDTTWSKNKDEGLKMLEQILDEKYS